jgi:hypothetical protein
MSDYEDESVIPVDDWIYDFDEYEIIEDYDE